MYNSQHEWQGSKQQSCYTRSYPKKMIKENFTEIIKYKLLFISFS